MPNRHNRRGSNAESPLPQTVDTPSESPILPHDEEQTLPDADQPVIADEPVTTDLPALTPEILPTEKKEEEVETKRAVIFDCEITRDGIFNKDGKPVEPKGNIYGRMHYENSGSFVNIAGVAGRIANQLFRMYKTMSKGVDKRNPFMLTFNILYTDRNELIKVDVKTRLNNPVNIAFSIAKQLEYMIDPNSGEALLTGDFEVSAEGRLFNSKLGLPAEVNLLPYHMQEDVQDERRKVINENNRLNKKAVLEVIEAKKIKH